jgi:hypothetical protein
MRKPKPANAQYSWYHFPSKLGTLTEEFASASDATSLCCYQLWARPHVLEMHQLQSVLAGFSPHQLLWLPPHDLLRSPRGWGLLFSWHIKSCNPAIFTQPRMHLSHHMLIHNITTQIQLNKIENINFFATSWSQDDQEHLPFEGGHYFVAAPGVWVACTHPWNSSWPKVLKIKLLVGSGDFWHTKFEKCLQWCICKDNHGLCVFATQKCSEMICLPGWWWWWAWELLLFFLDQLRGLKSSHLIYVKLILKLY